MVNERRDPDISSCPNCQTCLYSHSIYKELHEKLKEVKQADPSLNIAIIYFPFKSYFKEWDDSRTALINLIPKA